MRLLVAYLPGRSTPWRPFTLIRVYQRPGYPSATSKGIVKLEVLIWKPAGDPQQTVSVHWATTFTLTFDLITTKPIESIWASKGKQEGNSDGSQGQAADGNGNENGNVNGEGSGKAACKNYESLSPWQGTPTIVYHWQ